MSTEANQLNTQLPVIAYARLLVEMHRLIAQGKGDSAEAEALADRMDASWYAMTAREQSRMRGLSSDLHALRENNTKRVDMTPDQLAAWQHAARAYTPGEILDADAALDFWRRAVPS